jgi:phage repressor protein C with HTH and peptisase S24 domain
MLMSLEDAMPALRREKLKKWIEDNLAGSQAKFVEITGINQGELSALLKEKSFGEKKARKLEAQAGMPDFYLDTPIVDAEAKPRPMFSRTGRMPLVEIDEQSEFVAIKRVDLKISAGISGYSIDYIDGERSPIFFRRDWLEKNGYEADKLFAIPVGGESMIPTLYPDDMVVGNAADTKQMEGEVYAVNYEGELVIKRLHREAGQWFLSSDNADKRRFANKLCHENCFIIGRIIYKQSERI